MIIHRITAVAVAIAMVFGLLAITPNVVAAHTCSLSVGADGGHAPADQWTRHNHPRFYETGHCRVSSFDIDPSWAPPMSTTSWEHHPTLDSGVYSEKVRAHYTVDHWHSQGSNHCHRKVFGWCVSWHWHDSSYNHVHSGTTGWMTSPTVKIDITPPTTAISNVAGPYVDGQYVTSNTVISVVGDDAHSGVSVIQYRVDDGPWQSAAGGATIEGDDGVHTFTYRTVDNVGLVTEKSRTFILDNTGPVGDMVSPESNSASAGQYGIETCDGDPRAREGSAEMASLPVASSSATLDAAFASGMTELAAIMAGVPDTPEPPADVTTPGMPAEVQDAMPGAPDAPSLKEPEYSAPGATAGDPCAGQVVQTSSASVTFPAAPDAPAVEAPSVDVPPEVQVVLDENGVAVPDAPDAPEAPGVPDVPEVPRYGVAQPVWNAMDMVPSDPTDVSAPEAPETEGVDAPVAPDAPDAPDTPEAPAVPGGASADAASVDFTPFVVVQGVVDFVVDVADNLAGTKNVQFIVDGSVLGDQAGGDGRFTFTWDTSSYAAGGHSVTLRFFDRLGNQDQLDFDATVVSSTAPEAEEPEAPEAPAADVPEVPAI